MNFHEIFGKLLAFELFVVFLSFSLSVGMLVLTITSLVSCIKTQHDKDRLTWVLIIILVPVIGPIIYFTMAHKSDLVQSATGLPPSRIGAPVTLKNITEPPFDHSLIHDERYRAASINEALRNMGKSSRNK
ncbi:MAG: PLD nuclease N-terminal domain-containing protein [Cephaloticoccus sp.]|nr:PLD nuclease N-terminal domain-containing protein [Cephaloticoccus sp.]